MFGAPVAKGLERPLTIQQSLRPASLNSMSCCAVACRHACVHLLEGHPGTGKTTMALCFLFQGVKAGERCLCVALSESEEELHASARSHGWNLDGVDVMEVVVDESRLERQQSVFASGEFCLGETVAAITERVQQLRPTRLVIDSLAELQLMADDPMRYRRQVMALRRHLQALGATTLLLNDITAEREYDLQTLVHGVLSLEMIERHYGAAAAARGRDAGCRLPARLA